MLTREQILAVDDLRRETVKAWGDEVCVRVMRMDEMEAFTKISGALADGDEPSILRWMALLMAHTVCDDSGALLFSVEDVDALMRKSPESAEIVVDVALRLNRMGRYGKSQSEDAAGKS